MANEKIENEDENEDEGNALEVVYGIDGKYEINGTRGGDDAFKDRVIRRDRTQSCLGKLFI